MNDSEPSSVVMTHERTEVHFASYPHVFIEDSVDAPAAVTINGVSIKRTIPAFFSRKDGCALAGWRVPMGECVIVATIAGKHPKQVTVSYKGGCITEVKAA